MLKAVKWGDISLIKNLLAAGAEVNIPPGSSHDTLGTAIDTSNDVVLGLLLDARADLGIPPCEEGEKSCRTALASAIANRNTAMAQVLFSYGADPCDSLALQCAVEECVDGYSGSLDLLLSEFERSYPGGMKKYNPTPLKLVISLGELQLMEKIWAKTSDCFSHDDDWVQRNFFNDDWVEELRDFSDFEATTPLAVAILKDYGHSLKEVQWLLGKGVNVDSIVTLSPKLTALSLAVKTKSVEMVELFLSCGANIHHPASWEVERTALQQAAEIGSFRIVKLLLDREADVNAAVCSKERLPSNHGALATSRSRYQCPTCQSQWENSFGSGRRMGPSRHSEPFIISRRKDKG